MSTIIFVVGPAGSGKSTTSQLLAAKLGAAYIDKDTACNGLTEALLSALGADPTERDNSPIYQQQVMDLEYDTIMRIASSNLQLGNRVVLDAPFGRYTPREDYVEAAATTYGWPSDAHAVVVHVRVDGDEVRRRIAKRGLARDAWKLEHWDQFWATAGRDVCTWRGAKHLTFDNSPINPDFTALVEQIPA